MELKYHVPVGGVAPPSRVYESLVLTLELHRRSEEIRGVCLHTPRILRTS